jgi:uncharacterized membrane protein YgcG
MRTKLRKYTILLVTALLMLLGLTALPAGAADIKLYDEGRRLSPSELTECEDRLRQASDYTNMNIAVILGAGDRSDLTIETTCKTAYSELFGVRTDGISYYIDLKGYSPYDYIATFGRGQFYYTDGSPDRVYSIEEQVAPSLRPVGSENVYEAVMKFCELAEYYYDAGVPEYYCVYDDQDRMYYYMDGDEMRSSSTKPFRDPSVMFGVTAVFLVLGTLIAVFVYAGVKHAYKFKYELSPTTYVNRKNVAYREQYDNFTHTSTSRVAISSDSRGGGGSHSGGMGHSSGGIGGGGYHR